MLLYTFPQRSLFIYVYIELIIRHMQILSNNDFDDMEELLTDDNDDGFEEDEENDDGIEDTDKDEDDIMGEDNE